MPMEVIGGRMASVGHGAHIAELEAAIVRLNDVLNEMWGREDCKEFAAPLGARQIDKIMEAQNAAFALVERK